MNYSAKELPNNSEAEQAILGALFIYPEIQEVVFDRNVTKEDFFFENNQRIFEAMLHLREQAKPIDVVNVVSYLQDNSELQLVGGIDYIDALSDSAVSKANVSYYIDIIQNKAHARALIEVAKQIEEAGYDASIDLDTLLDDAERDLLAVTRNRRVDQFKSARTIIHDVVAQIEMLRTRKSHITGIRTGYTDLDRLTNGFQRGDLIILAARPSMGKTALALNVALGAAERNPGAVAFFSLEMPAEQLMIRLLSAKGKIEGSKLRSGYLNDEEMNRLSETATEMTGLKLFIDDSAMLKMPEVFSKCRKLKSEQGLDLIVVDYLQLISGNTRYASENRQQEVSDISRNLKALARELEVPVIALSQLSRSVEARADKRPMLSDLRESGAIEQDADIVMFLYRDDYYEKDDEKRNEDSVDTEIDIQKHRNGQTGKLYLQFKKSINAFYNLERR